jgi:hypothetical protein
VRIWQPFIASSLKQLHEDNRTTNRSLGIIRPDPVSIKFLVKPAYRQYKRRYGTDALDHLTRMYGETVEVV